jgi:hypothetical protein
MISRGFFIASLEASYDYALEHPSATRKALNAVLKDRSAAKESGLGAEVDLHDGMVHYGLFSRLCRNVFGKRSCRTNSNSDRAHIQRLCTVWSTRQYFNLYGKPRGWLHPAV